MMRPFNDETEVRTLAQQALERTASSLFEEAATYVYMKHVRHADFDTMMERYISMSFNPIPRDLIDVPEVHKSFDAGQTEGG